LREALADLRNEEVCRGAEAQLYHVSGRRGSEAPLYLKANQHDIMKNQQRKAWSAFGASYSTHPNAPNEARLGWGTRQPVKSCPFTKRLSMASTPHKKFPAEIDRDFIFTWANTPGERLLFGCDEMARRSV
jgi:hypothetical protein